MLPPRVRFLFRAFFVLALLGLLGVASAAPQQQPQAPPPRPTTPQMQEISPPEPPQDEGINLNVQVIDASTGQPLPGVLIELKRNPLFNSPQSAADRRRWTYSKTTDRQGAVTISNIIADRYAFTSKLMGYTAAKGAMDSITLAPRAKPAPIALRMWQSSSVEGTVKDREDHPVPDTVVEILEEDWTFGLRILVLAQSVKADAEGKYSFPAVLPGTYYIRARPPAGTVQQQLKASEQTTEKKVAFVDTLYPSAIFLEQAGPLTLIPGLNQTGLNIEMQRSKYYSLSGRVFGIPTEAQKSAGLVLIRRVGFDSPFPFVWSTPYDGSIGVRLAADGTFSAPNVPPGPYWAGYTPAGVVRGGAQFEIIDRDVDDFRTEVTAGATFSGKAIYEDGTAVESRPANLSIFVPNMGIYERGFSLRDGAFMSGGLPAGTYRLEFPGSAVRKVEIDGNIFQGGEFQLNAHSGPAVITLSRLGGGIRGSVDLHDLAKSYPRGMVTVTPVPQRPTDLPKKIYLNGRTSFAADHLNAGRYRVCAWLEEGAEVNSLLGNPRYDGKLAIVCETVVLSTDEHKQLQLKQISAVELR